MGVHARPSAWRAPAVRAAVAAVLAAVAGTVLVGIGGIGGVGGSPAGPPAQAPRAAAGPASAPDRSGAQVAVPNRLSPDQVAAVPTSARSPETATEPDPPVQQAPVPAPQAVSVRSDPAAPSLVAGTPCTTTARACVDIGRRTAWLIDGGAVVRGPAKIMAGDRDDPTPRGTFRVQWKAEQYTSREYLRQMPYAVFFADGGVAFHEGSQDTYSAGCVKLTHDDAVAWFGFLQTGDEVQVR